MLMELHVAMHVICAIIMYLLWWDRPQDINEPVALVEDLGEACIKLLRSEGSTPEWELQEGRGSLDWMRTILETQHTATRHQGSPYSISRRNGHRGRAV